jgi:hypothetical protein
MKEPYVPKPKPPFPYARPLSWSQISTFKYNPRQWYARYVEGEETEPSIEMLFGKEVGDRIAADPTYLPEVPRLSIFEHELKFDFNGIPMIGYMDSYEPHTKMKEYKTGRKKWDQQRVNQHGQIDLYLLGTWQLQKVRPEDIDCELHWLPTHIKDGQVAFVDPFKVHTFKANRTMADILRFGQEIMNIRKEMEEYYHQQTHIYTTDFFAK